MPNSLCSDSPRVYVPEPGVVPEIAAVGGKARNLALLAMEAEALGGRVPRWVAITTRSFDEALARVPGGSLLEPEPKTLDAPVPNRNSELAPRTSEARNPVGRTSNLETRTSHFRS